MQKTSSRIVSTVALVVLLLSSIPGRLQAQTYPIDCAILLCLSGGWPTSVPCTRARAEFIRRITPWPVEPPLQIWRCPMGASFDEGERIESRERLFEARLQSTLQLQLPSRKFDRDIELLQLPATGDAGPLNGVGTGLLQLVQSSADIDISGREFDFVRSIRVFDVRYAHQRESGRDGDCNRSAIVVVGTYGIQGEFSWHRASVASLPAAHVGLEEWGRNCPSIFHRSVFVEWRDFDGDYGFEQVNY